MVFKPITDSRLPWSDFGGSPRAGREVEKTSREETHRKGPGTGLDAADQEMKNMIHRKLAILSSAGFLVFVTACGPSAGTIEKKTESTTKSAEGTVKTTTETKQVGTTLESKTETKADTPSGTVKAKTETIVGTVTVFTAGKKLEVMTGEKNMHSFTLDDKDISYSIDGNVAVGKRVTVIDQTGDDKVRRITVKLGG
jgi:hypothetical protein